MVRRREVIAGLGAAVAWPLAARAQQPAMPVIGYLSARSSESDASMLVAVRRGLGEAGYVEGRNLAIEYRFADGQYDRLPALATDLTSRHVAVIVFAGPGDGMVRFMRASQIPIVFATADAVRRGFVSSLNRPGGNMTGIETFAGELTAKRVGLLHELVPDANTIALLVDADGAGAGGQGQVERDAREAAATLGVQLLVLNAATEGEIDAAVAAASRQRPPAMLVQTSPFFVTRAKQIAALAARHGLPAIYARREFAEAGGLMSYGYDVADGYRQVGNYAGRILKGEKPADLPVVQPTRFEFIINLKTAKALGFEIPAKVLALADEVIE
jgi:putative tryptophan/tyrosine transport system substrate-binding protein